MVELADTTDLSSVDGNIVRVQVPLPVLTTCRLETLDLVCWDTNDRQCGCLKTLAGMILVKEYIHSVKVKPSFRVEVYSIIRVGKEQKPVRHNHILITARSGIL